MKNLRNLLLLFVAFMLLLTGCGKEEDKKQIDSVTREESVSAPSDDGADKDESKPVEETTDKDSSETSDAKLETVMEEIKTEIGADNALDFNVNSMYALYGIQAADIKQCAGFSLMEGTFPHEIVMIEASNDEAAQRIETAFNAKIASFAAQSKNYDAKNYALAQKCEVIKNGRYFAMFLTPDYDAVKAVYTKYIK